MINLRHAIARVRHTMPINPDVRAVCDALEAVYDAVGIPLCDAQTPDLLSPVGALKPDVFDRTAYQREYMRDKRIAEKLGMTVRQLRDEETLIQEQWHDEELRREKLREKRRAEKT
jgi:hypothetical protein